jgi:hypothetical protein
MAWPALELIGARPSGRSRPRRLAARWGNERGHHEEFNLASVEAWKAAKRQRTSGGTSARKGGEVGAVRAKRSVGGVGVFTEGEVAFYRAAVRRGRLGAFNGWR